MKQNFKFQLDKSSKKFYCPKCEEKTFARYRDIITMEYLPEKYGRCDRSNNCQHHKNPYLDRYISNHVIADSKFVKKNRDLPLVFFDKQTFEKIVNENRYSKNAFLNNLLVNVRHPFCKKDIDEVAKLYKLGTIVKGSKQGAVAFPFIDINSNIRAVHVKQFDVNNNTKGKPDFFHSMLVRYLKGNLLPIPPWLSSYFKSEKKVSCLFGEHLLKQFPDNPVVLVEAPKTVIYGTLYYGFPREQNDKIWLAVGSKDTFTLDRLKILKNRKVTLYPDLSKDGSTFKQWENKANYFKDKIPGVQFIVSDFLERKATYQEKIDGLDIADFLIKEDWRKYRC
ncbi:DUF6371 domain-containing protein [Chryseobacterium luquanense]|uniref:DUF6371 domain-containing protein n=1 Tax=Chryseobacterium luquanense TaxID=2983766 RepID=A0ABT3Y828_9FLAO|nr:DUF6371 domain-containing protein [Chryseobacterium luquanense]MCX8534330.1 DUF6371 domain-containing protein [Chryseobacterium luquanense]